MKNLHHPKLFHSFPFSHFRRDFLEKEENTAESFIAITRVLVVLAQNYTRYFKPHFEDIVDIIIGWLLESKQGNDVKQQCSMALQSFRQCWLNESEFSQNLLQSLSEDVDTCLEKLNETSGKQKVYKEFGSFIGKYCHIHMSYMSRKFHHSHLLLLPAHRCL